MTVNVRPLMQERARLLAESDALRIKVATGLNVRKAIERKREISKRLQEIATTIRTHKESTK